MKRMYRTNIILLLLFIVPSVISVLLIADWLEILSFMPPWGKYIALAFPALPFFCLQLLMCRVGRKNWVKALPLILVLAFAFAAFLGLCMASGWDTLGWMILLILCAAPAAGCIIALLPYWLRKK